MFEIGDYVVNATNGICRISEIVELDMSGDKKLKSYFLLRPIEEEHDRVYIPVDNADKRIRKVITEEEAQAVIDRVPQIDGLVITSEKERETKYKEAVRSCEPDTVVSLLKCLHDRNEERTKAGKKSTAVDERYWKMAENNLHAELAFVLKKDKQEIKEIIYKML
ncbi:CarD family transcriptional regulator [Agathobacter sp.]